jgi:hypothetical protein
MMHPGLGDRLDRRDPIEVSGGDGFGGGLARRDPRRQMARRDGE